MCHYHADSKNWFFKRLCDVFHFSYKLLKNNNNKTWFTVLKLNKLNKI